MQPALASRARIVAGHKRPQAIQSDCGTMTDGYLTRTVIVTNPQGFHARPADLFVKLASQFQAKIEVVKDGERVDGKSILAILTLAAVEGTRLDIEASGPDAEAALNALSELIQHDFGENGTIVQQ
jgi:phosphotransferase system HPr (HPr) family protein